MIQATVSGHIGSVKLVKKPTTPQENGFTVLTFSVASNSASRSGEEITNWVTGKLWGPRAEALAPHLVKGQAVVIQGRPEARGYASGNELRGELTVHVSNFEFLGPKPESAPGQVQGEPEPHPTPKVD
jgi:single-stranded DNA-binding protein